MKHESFKIPLVDGTIINVDGWRKKINDVDCIISLAIDCDEVNDISVSHLATGLHIATGSTQSAAIKKARKIFAFWQIKNNSPRAKKSIQKFLNLGFTLPLNK